MTKARKFKKKLPPKARVKKAEQVLSVEIVKKETLERVSNVWKKLISKFKSLKLAN